VKNVQNWGVIFGYIMLKYMNRTRMGLQNLLLPIKLTRILLF
jgi:hypothetical protein